MHMYRSTSCCQNEELPETSSVLFVNAPTWGLCTAEVAKTSKLALAHEKEKALALHIIRFPEALEVAIGELAPHRLTEYLYELSDYFNSFYVELKVRLQ